MNLLSQTREQSSAQSKNRFFVNCGIAFLLLASAFAGSVQAQSVTLAWDPVSGVSGYKLYQGSTSHVYTNSINAGAATQQTLSGLTVGSIYYFAVTAYNSSGVESDYSSEVIYVATSGRPPPTGVLHLTKLTGRVMNVSGLGSAGHVYEVQASQNLKNWTVLGSVTADSSGTVSFTDNSAPSYSNRCYRLRDTTP
jgi:fibronectin type 3 domain-containing protein